MSLTSNHKSNIRRPKYWLALLLPFFLQSCGILSDCEIEASIDAAFQEFCGPSYPQASCDEFALFMNVAVLYAYGPAALGSSASSNETEDQGLLADVNYHVPFQQKYLTPSNAGESSKIKSSDTFMDNILFMGGLELINKKSKDGGSKVNLVYLEVPLYALYQKELGTGQIFGGLGPFFAYGIGGNTKETFSGTKFNSFDKDFGYKPLDFGISLTAGYQLPNGFRFRLATDRGLANLQRGNSGNKAKNVSYSLNVAYPLNKLMMTP